MTREQLAAAHAHTVRKHWRTLDDHSGTIIPSQLLDDLAAIADQHATDVTRQADAERTAPRPPAKRKAIR